MYEGVLKPWFGTRPVFYSSHAEPYRPQENHDNLHREHFYMSKSFSAQNVNSFLTLNNGVHMNINEDGIFMDEGFRV